MSATLQNSVKQSEKQTWGWLTAGLLFLALSPSAWALDLDQSISHQESLSTTLIASLAHDQAPDAMTSSETRRTVQMQLIRAPKRSAKSKRSFTR